MKWEDTALEALKLKFGNEVFGTEDAFRVLNREKRYSKGTVHRILHDLCKRGSVERLGRGIYRIPKIAEFKEGLIVSEKLTLEPVPGPLNKVRDLLKEKGIEFMITGGSALYRFHHLPRRLIHLIYVVRGSGELTATLLREAGLRVLLNPKRSEVNMALENFTERDIFLVREFYDLLGNVDGGASLERALVDLYFESTRGRIPYPEEEVGRIFSRVLRDERINISRLFMLADRRGIKEEMKAVVKFIEPEIPVKVRPGIKYVKKVLRTMEKEALR